MQSSLDKKKANKIDLWFKDIYYNVQIKSKVKNPTTGKNSFFKKSFYLLFDIFFI